MLRNAKTAADVTTRRVRLFWFGIFVFLSGDSGSPIHFELIAHAKDVPRVLPLWVVRDPRMTLNDEKNTARTFLLGMDVTS